MTRSIYSVEPFLYIIKKEKLYNEIKIVKIPGNGQGIFAGYSKKLDKKIIDRIEGEILKYNKDHTLEKLVKKYMDFN